MTQETAGTGAATKTKSGAKRKGRPKKRTRRAFGGSVFERSDRPGVLFGRFTDPRTGARRLVKLVDGTDEGARQKAEDRLADEIRKARETDPSSGERRVVTLAKFVEEFLPLAESRVGPRHAEDLRDRLNRAAAYFGTTSLARIGKSEAEDYLVKLAKEDGRPRIVVVGKDDEGKDVTKTVMPRMSPTTVWRHRAALLACWRAAVERNAASANPWKAAKPKKAQRFAPRFLTSDEVARVLAHVPARHRPLFAFLSATGLRLGEAQALTWVRVAPDRARVTVETSKSGKTRSVPCSASARDVLAKLWDVHVTPATGPDLVFPAYERTYLWSVWQRACLAAGVGRGVRIHDLRHYVGSSLAQNGTPLSTIQRILGHGSARMTEIYASHVPANAEALAFAALDAARGVTPATAAPKTATA
jgi:integrase